MRFPIGFFDVDIAEVQTAEGKRAREGLIGREFGVAHILVSPHKR